jgi:hypothetical protein
MGLLAEGYACLYEQSGREDHLRQASAAAEWLVENRDARLQGYMWGLPIPFRSRVFFPAGTCYTIVTVVCGEAFWRLFQATGKEEYLEACRRVCEGLLRNLHVDIPRPGSVCFSYSPLDCFHVHNVNLWAAAFLVKVAMRFKNEEYLEWGLRAAQYALDDQREDGSLTYWGSDQDANGALDHFHTGFEIRAFHSLAVLTGEARFRRAAERFFDYYKLHFFGPDGMPFRNPDSEELVDVHGCAEAMICSAQLAADMPGAWELLQRATRWTMMNMQAPEGYFIYRIETRKGRQTRLEIPFIRWGQAWMLRALAAYFEASGKRADHP